MSSAQMRRIGKELADIHDDTKSQIKAKPVHGDNITHLMGSFPGPPGTPYEGGTYNIEIKIPTDYPFKPPVMRFDTKIWHPNISSQTGAICLDTLAGAWSPVLTIKSSLLSLQSLLGDPEPKDPQDAEVANMMLQRPKEFIRVARQWAIIYAGAIPYDTKDEDGGMDEVQEIPIDLSRYDGYSQNLVDQFCSMGFDVDQVVRGFQQAGMNRNEMSLGEADTLHLVASMIEDDIYRTSSQFRLWSYTQASLQSLRASTNIIASERVRIALQRTRELQSATSSAAGTPQPGSDNEVKKQDEKGIDPLTPEEELILVRYYCEQTLKLGETYKPPLPTIVRATAIQYLRRFYLTNSPMTYHPKSIMSCALFLATKTDNYYMSLRQFAEGIPGETSQEEVIAPEFLLIQGLRFTFDVRHPFRGLEGGAMELQAIAEGQGLPTPHFPNQDPIQLQKTLLSIAPPTTPSSSITDRIARAHGMTRETLKSAAQLTDVYFLYTPSQIWLAAFLLADRPLAEFYLETKLDGPATETDNQSPLYELRIKLFKILNDCAAILQAYTPLSTDPEQMKNLKRIAKKLYQCQKSSKGNLKRDSAQPRVPGVAGVADSGQLTESETDRLAKKQKLEQDQDQGRNMFGPELVTDRFKQ
ncbi:hypothetical protein N7495_001034 [Penicillium taxi]|uniref:uncharacterized protein n=1 Tax=Penicillium taxi TaxID=168475 RepID=UPI0025456053|nr:uncharacterized protein N7495_001034 [Penicillium taxi]KAJ5908352.1 hypothetical protein N7495_001034 [Penicillium taxi]